jgi:hypothetical protein
MPDQITSEPSDPLRPGSGRHRYFADEVVHRIADGGPDATEAAHDDRRSRRIAASSWFLRNRSRPAPSSFS